MKLLLRMYSTNIYPLNFHHQFPKRILKFSVARVRHGNPMRKQQLRKQVSLICENNTKRKEKDKWLERWNKIRRKPKPYEHIITMLRLESVRNISLRGCLIRISSYLNHTEISSTIFIPTWNLFRDETESISCTSSSLIKPSGKR